jgi:hypothetical protein
MCGEEMEMEDGEIYPECKEWKTFWSIYRNEEHKLEDRRRT